MRYPHLNNKANIPLQRGGGWGLNLRCPYVLLHWGLGSPDGCYFGRFWKLELKPILGGTPSLTLLLSLFLCFLDPMIWTVVFCCVQPPPHPPMIDWLASEALSLSLSTVCVWGLLNMESSGLSLKLCRTPVLQQGSEMPVSHRRQKTGLCGSYKEKFFPQEFDT